MKKIWPYISAFLGGALLMAIAALKWFAGEDIEVNVRKVKNKRTSGETSTNIPIDIEKPQMDKKSRLERKNERMQQRIERRKQKAEQRLNKLT